MKKIELTFSFYDNIFQLFEDIVESKGKIKLLSYYEANTSCWDNKDCEYLCRYSSVVNGVVFDFFAKVSSNGDIKETHFECSNKASLTED